MWTPLPIHRHTFEKCSAALLAIVQKKCIYNMITIITSLRLGKLYIEALIMQWDQEDLYRIERQIIM